MGTEEVDKLIARGREQYHSLLEEATELLRNLDTDSPKAISKAIQRRQDLVETLQSFDARFYEGSVETDDKLAEFREFQKDITKKILEVDGLVVALAREKQAAVKRKLSSMSRSVAASKAYEKMGTAKRPWGRDSV